MDNSKFYKFLKEETGKNFDDESPNYYIEKDLNIYGDEAEDFLMKFSNEFKVDITSFNFGEHFNPEADKIYLWFYNLFYKKNKKDLTIEDLKKAIIKTKLE
ncbi:DUF1493 family protein [Flavobacterium sp. 1355]|jgi:acyl carrier protein|uniref:DUF1493 family protein n=1 Tax=Flavobacterium sp. 1355 TaxID=2806571 RepID=UPI001AE0FC46|nr:DUF1493 family protein [Flavobacterium sp. 1355]MBP1224728.1 acyl carrier protein [Flavobacterium sp. 1355]